MVVLLWVACSSPAVDEDFYLCLCEQASRRAGLEATGDERSAQHAGLRAHVGLTTHRPPQRMTEDSHPDRRGILLQRYSILLASGRNT